MPKLNVKVGEVVNVLWMGQDLACGDTHVVAINSRTGSITLANKMKFHADGRGHSGNQACDIGPAHYPWNDLTRPYADRNRDYKAFRQQVNPGEAVQDLHLQGWER